MSKINKDAVIMEVLDYLALECYKNAKDKGFWDDETKLLSLIIGIEENGGIEETYSDELQKRIISLFNSEKIALEHSELSERLEVLRKNPGKQDEHCPEFLNIEIECADLIIRCLDFCGRRDLRIGEALIAKMKYNSGREKMHGKNF